MTAIRFQEHLSMNPSKHLLTYVADSLGREIARRDRFPYFALTDNPFIPPLKIDYNSVAKTQSAHKREYQIFCQNILPFLVRTYGLARFFAKPEIRIFDMGCGFGKLAYALRHLVPSSPTRITYTGLDIRADAIQWCREAYKGYGFQFVHHKTESAVDYVDGAKGGHQTVSNSSGEEGAYKLDTLYDIQWSCSVFTHMTEEACNEALSAISRHSAHDGLQVNTWLVIDDMSRYSLQAGLADRELPIDAGPFLTSSERNPLVCTAYKIEKIQQYYERHGLSIAEVLPGSWRGHSNNGIVYQDIIVSRKGVRPIKSVGCGR